MFAEWSKDRFANMAHGISNGPDLAAVRQCLPACYHKAFDRAAGAFWRDKHNDGKPLYLTLSDRRGRYLNTLYAQPYDFAPGKEA